MDNNATDPNRMVREMHARSMTNLNRFFLMRLERFARIAKSAESSGIVQWQQLANRATLSAYQDCVEAGMEAEARKIIGEAFRR